MRLTREDSLLLVIDIQRKLAPAILDHERVTARTEALVTRRSSASQADQNTARSRSGLVEPLRSRFSATKSSREAFSATDHRSSSARYAPPAAPGRDDRHGDARVVMQAALGCVRRPRRLHRRRRRRLPAARSAIASSRSRAWRTPAASSPARNRPVRVDEVRNDERFRSMLALVKSF